MAILAARKIFKVVRPVDDVELQTWLDQNPGTRNVLDEYSDPNALICDVIRAGRIDEVAAWACFVKMHPSLQSGWNE